MLLLSGLLACGPGRRINAPPPARVADTGAVADTGLPPAPTYASAPVSVDLRLILDEINRTIPTHMGSLDKRLLVATSPRTWVALEILRGPLDIDFGPSSMTLSAVVAYRGRVWRKVPLTTVSASCGTGDRAPLARIRIRTDYRITPSWRIRTESRVLDVQRATAEAADDCRITFLGIDVTTKVLAAAKDAIDKALRVADAQLGAVDVRGAVRPVWAAMQQPMPIADSTLWLALRPTAVGVGPVAVRDSFAHATITVMAQPRISSGDRPEPDSTPLPDLTKVQAADTLSATVDATLGYDVANEMLRKELRGKRFWIRGRRIVVRDIGMTYLGASRVALNVLLGGAATGRVYFIGTPTYDAAADAITVPDLTYDVQTSNLLVQGITWLAGDKLRDGLRRQARVPAGTMLELVRGLANKEITRTLADGVQLSGALGSAEAMSVRATSAGLRARARTTGKLALHIRVESVFANTHIPREPLKGLKDSTQAETVTR